MPGTSAINQFDRFDLGRFHIDDADADAKIGGALSEQLEIVKPFSGELEHKRVDARSATAGIKKS